MTGGNISNSENAEPTPARAVPPETIWLSSEDTI